MKSYIISFWNFMDPTYYYFSRLSYLPCNNNILRVRLTRYKGRNIVLSDGTQINRNDLLVKIHLHNVKIIRDLSEVKSDFGKGKMLYRLVQMSMPSLEAYIQNHSRTKEIKGIIGITALTKGCSRLGFEVVAISNPIYRWFKSFAFLPIELLSNQTTSIISTIEKYKPSYLFMSRDTLSKMYRQ